MNKTVYQIMSAIVLFALTVGSYSNAGASSEAAPQAAVTTYYVATTGNDASAGTSAAPFKTIQKCANVAASGNVCSVAAGTYAERVNVTRIGIVFQANGLVTMQGWTITGSDNTVNGFYVLNSTNGEGGIVIKSNGNKVINNKIERATLTGIHLQNNNNLVENNEILATQARGSSDADGMRFFGGNNIIRGNYIHDLTHNAESVAANAHIDCFQTWNDISKGIATNTIIENNVCDNQQWLTSSLYGQGFMIDGSNVASNITIRNNVIRAYQSYILNVSGLKIENNVFDIYINGAGLNLSNNPSSILKNNIFYASSNNTPIGVSVLSYPAPTGGWNWYYRLDGKYIRTDVVKFPTDKPGVNPLFTNPAGGNFSLQPNSPACTSGENGSYVGAFPCGVTAPTTTPTIAVTNTPVITASVTSTSTLIASTPMASATTTSTLIASTPMASATPTSTLIASTPMASATPTSIPITNTPIAPSKTPTVMPTATPVLPTATKTAVPVQPTSTSVPPTATVQQQSQSGVETVYDDKHGNFSYSSDWRDVTIGSASGGSFKKTTQNGSSVTFTFTGQSFSVLYTSGPKFGKMNVYIDGVLVGTISENGKTTVYQKRWDYPGQLTFGTHSLKLVADGATYPNGSLDAVIVR